MRKVGPHGLDSIDYSMMSAWSQLRGIKMEDWEIGTILRMDRSYLAHVRAGAPGADSSPTGEQVSSRPLSLELFDALFP